jgi:hypothetical protein
VIDVSKMLENSIEKNKQKNSFNEFYTTYENADEVLGALKEQGFLDDIKTICCPCDGAHSNIVKWLQNNTKAKIVYFDYLDVNSVRARKKMLQCGCVITNPPFSADISVPFLKFLKSNKIPYLIWGPLLMPINCFDYLFTAKKKRGAMARLFKRPDGSMTIVSNHVYYTNFDVDYPDYNYEPPKVEQFYDGIPFYDSYKNIPKDYYGWFYAPMSARFVIKHYDIDLKRSKKSISNRFCRLCMRRRKE